MKNKNGFTLIELLAVIVILGVITLIAVPAVSHLIEKAKIGAIKTSASSLIDASSLYSSNEMKDDQDKVIFTIKNGTQTSTTGELLSYDGKIENGIAIVYIDGVSAVCIDNGTLYAKKSTTETEITVGVGTCGDAIAGDTDFNVLSTVEALTKELEEIKALEKSATAKPSDLPNGVTAVVDGELITGTGTSNTNSYNSGYTAGYTAGTNAGFKVVTGSISGNNTATVYIGPGYTTVYAGVISGAARAYVSGGETMWTATVSNYYNAGTGYVSLTIWPGASLYINGGNNSVTYVITYK